MAGITAIKRIGYLHGGVTHPDGRRGFFKGAERDSREKGTSMSPGTDSRGNQRDQSSSGQRDDLRNYNFNPNTPNPDGRPNYFITPPSKPKPTKKNKVDQGFFKNYFQNHPFYNAANKFSKNKFNTNQNAKARTRYLEKLKKENPEQFKEIMGDFAKLNYVTEETVPPSMGFKGLDMYNFETIDGRNSLGEDQAKAILGINYQEYLNNRFPENGGGGGNPYILPQYSMMGGGADMGSEDVEEKTYDYHLGLGGQQTGANVLRGYAADGGIMGTRARRAMGGIMDRVDKRQQFFLGGIGKAIGKIGKAAGKVLKSDVGKMALLAAGTYYAGGGNLFGMKRATDLDKFSFGQIPGAKFLMGGGKDGKYLDRFNPLKVGAFGLGALSLFGNKAAPNEDIGMTDRGGRLIDPLTGQEGTPASMRANIENAKIEADGDPVKLASLNQKYNNMLFSILPYENYGTYAQGGRIKAEEGGLMNLGGMEKDYRAEGGFVPIGKQEKADDVPARLSVNEFVFTADAVRNAGSGDIDKGAEVMENMMKNLENGGRVSEESQGNTGAQNMFSVSERIGEVI